MTREELEAGCIRIPCPRCEAGQGEACNKPDGSELHKPHRDRVKAYGAELERARLRAEGDATHRIDSVRWRRVYSACRLELENRAAWTPLAAEQLESMVLNMQEAERARAQAKAKPTTEGSMGQAVPNPAVQVALRYDAQALATASSLKLTPDKRGTSVEVPDAPEDPSPDDGDTPDDELAVIDFAARRLKAAAASKGRRKRAAK